MSKTNRPIIKLYGANRCDKIHDYINFFNETGLPFEFLDVELNKDHAKELRGLYLNKKLNFPKLTIGSKKLRNSVKDELEKWLNI